MLNSAYVEIGNICNMNCSFCPGTKRAPRQMSEEEFQLICGKLQGKVGCLYFHVMGEPLLHPKLERFLQISKSHGFLVSITTNGTLLAAAAPILLRQKDSIHRISISLHASEANGMKATAKEYLDSVISFAKTYSSEDKNVVLRLWNLDTKERLGKNSNNDAILKRLREEYPDPWEKRYSGYRLAYRTFLEFDGIFTWPSESDAEPTLNGGCYALSRQIAILADGTVVPCCLDSEGQMQLGNIFTDELEKILDSERAGKIREGFQRKSKIEPLCQKCTYSYRFI